MTDALPDPADLEPGDDKARAALERFRITRAEDAAGPEFGEGYGALDAEFGAKGELERRAVVKRWLASGGRGAVGDGLAWEYHLLVARSDGQLAGVRDCHVTVDAARRECVVYLAHTLVLPAFRRGGLASLLRAAPLTLAKRALAAAGLPPPAADGSGADVLLAAEMEPADPGAPDTLVRLIAYGRSGYRVVPPAALPYCQPDFRDLALFGGPARPLPLLAVARWVAHPGAEALPKRLCAAYLRHLYAVFATHCHAADLEPPLRHAAAALRAAADPVPLLPLPRDANDAAALAPLLRDEVLRHHLATSSGR